MILMAKEPINPFQMRGPLQHLCGYRCSNLSDNPDVCNRTLSSGKFSSNKENLVAGKLLKNLVAGSHVIALLMLVLAPFLEGYWPVRRLALSDLRYPRHLQPGAVFPDHVSFGIFGIVLYFL